MKGNFKGKIPLIEYWHAILDNIIQEIDFIWECIHIIAQHKIVIKGYEMTI